MTIEKIKPHQLYSLAEAATLIPSNHAGKHTARETLHRWRKEGRLKCVGRPTAKRVVWFVWGSELLRLLHADERPEWQGRTPTEMKRAYEAAQRELARLGFSTGQHEKQTRETR